MCFIVCSTVQSTEVNPLAGELTDLVDAALARAGISHKAAAISMGIDPAQFSRQLHGQGNLSLNRMGRLPRRFWVEFVGLVAGNLGLALEANVDQIEAETNRLLAMATSLAAKVARRKGGE